MGIKEQLKLNNQQLQEHSDFIPTMPTADEVRNGQYTWHKYSVVDGIRASSLGFVVDDRETAYPIDGIHSDGYYYVLYGSPIKIVTWADGSDDDIVAMVEAADRGEINLSDYWTVGQERKVTLSAMDSLGSDVGESHEQQEVTFVLMNVGGKTLVKATESGRAECSFIVGMKNCLVNTGYMDLEDTAVDYSKVPRRIWCNTTFKNSIPSTLLPIFKQFYNISGKANNTAGVTIKTSDYFSLPAEIEVFGKVTNSVAGEGKQFQWYKTASRRNKKLGDNGAISEWWERSAYNNSSYSFMYGSETGGYLAESRNLGISPFGCI